MKRFLDMLSRISARVQPAMKERELEPQVGSWLDADVLKIRKKAWSDTKSVSPPTQSGIFFSVWIEENGIKRNRAFYNIHALRLRSLSGYSLQSREFAAAF